MRLMGELKSDKSGQIPDFGYVSAKEPTFIDEFKMVRIEAKRRCKIGEIKMPDGVTFTIHVLEDEKSEENEEG